MIQFEGFIEETHIRRENKHTKAQRWDERSGEQYGWARLGFEIGDGKELAKRLCCVALALFSAGSSLAQRSLVR